MQTKLINNNTGAAYMLALVTLLVGCVLALALLRAANTYFLAEDSRCKRQAEVYLAEAGLEYAYYQVHYQDQPLPFTAQMEMGSGSFKVEAIDDGGRDRSMMLMTSTGKCGRSEVVLKRVTLGLLPYHYAWCEDSSISSTNQFVSTSSGRGFRTNSDASLYALSNNISTGVWSAGHILAFGSVSPRSGNCPSISFPEISYEYYISNAVYYYSYDVLFTGLDRNGDVLIYVTGNATINIAPNKYRGAITIVCTGNITVKSNLTPRDNSSFLALVTTRDIIVESGASNVTAVLYAHRPYGTSTIRLNGNTTLVGSVSADDISSIGRMDITRDYRLNLEVMRRLKLPGL